MSSYTRREGTLGAWRKRKEQREPCDPPRTKPVAADAEPGSGSGSGSGSDRDNKVLAGYLAHEFLTRGTLFGKRFEPGKKDPNPVRAGSGEPPRAYAEVSYILRADGGAHVAGVVNPTQLARWIRIGGEDNAAKHQSK